MLEVYRWRWRSNGIFVSTLTHSIGLPVCWFNPSVFFIKTNISFDRASDLIMINRQNTIADLICSQQSSKITNTEKKKSNTRSKPTLIFLSFTKPLFLIYIYIYSLALSIHSCLQNHCFVERAAEEKIKKIIICYIIFCSKDCIEESHFKTIVVSQDLWINHKRAAHEGT